MNRSSYALFENDVKSKVADVIIKFNFLELALKELLVTYIDSKHTNFLRDIVFHNSVVSFNSKLTILQILTQKEGIPFQSTKEILHSLIKIRNAIAHSDNLLNVDGDLIGYEELDVDSGGQIPIYEPYQNGPKVTILHSGKVDEKGLDKLCEEFNEKITIVEVALDAISRSLASANNKTKFR